MESFRFKRVFFLLSYVAVASGLDQDYLNLECNTGVTLTSSRRLESSTALYYEPNKSCYYTVTVDAGKRVMALVRLFDLEAEVMGSCVDFVNFHDGSSTGATTLNPAPICDEDAAANYTSTGNQLTIYFETDSTGERLGFNFILVAITIAPCTGGQFACNNSICIDESLHCNRYDECGDNSDESGCDYTHLTGTEPNDKAPLIVGLSIGIPVIIVISLLIGYWCWRYHRWRLFMKRPLTTAEVCHDSSTFAETYPVTHIYYKPRFQPLYMDGDVKTSSYSRKEITISDQGSTSTRKPNEGSSSSENLSN